MILLSLAAVAVPHAAVRLLTSVGFTEAERGLALDTEIERATPMVGVCDVVCDCWCLAVRSADLGTGCAAAVG